MLLIILLKPTDIKPPFTEETAKSKIKSAQDAWNTCNPEIVVISIFHRFKMEK